MIRSIDIQISTQLTSYIHTYVYSTSPRGFSSQSTLGWHSKGTILWLFTTRGAEVNSYRVEIPNGTGNFQNLIPTSQNGQTQEVCIRANTGHQAGAYPGFCIIMRLGVFLLPPWWDASPSPHWPVCRLFFFTMLMFLIKLRWNCRDLSSQADRSARE